MPVIGHQAKAQDAHRLARFGLGQQFQEREVIVVLEEQLPPAIDAIHHVINQPARSDATYAWHGPIYNAATHARQWET